MGGAGYLERAEGERYKGAFDLEAISAGVSAEERFFRLWLRTGTFHCAIAGVFIHYYGFWNLESLYNRFTRMSLRYYLCNVIV